MKVGWSKSGRHLEVSTYKDAPLVALMEQRDEAKVIALNPSEARRVGHLLLAAAAEVEARG